MDNLFWLLLIPLVIPLIARFAFHHTITWQEMGIHIMIVVGVVGTAYGISYAVAVSSTMDTEILNGHITSKHRKHGSYVEAYQCNCITVCTGTGTSRSCTEVCSTCYRDHYTVEWYANSTVGTIRFKYLDSLSRSVYATPDPSAYTRCVVGEPASALNRFQNLVLASPDSVFNTENALNAFTGKIPRYPSVYDYYRINRVVNVDSSVDGTALGELLDEELKVLGPTNQVNVIVILTEIDDPSYRHAVENAWLGGKKNDVVVFIGLDGDNITWSDTMTYALNSGNELFRVTLRDRISSMEQYEAQLISNTISTTIKQLYDRPQMADFAYLKENIKPNFWTMFITGVIGVLLSIALTYFFHKNGITTVHSFRVGKKVKSRYYRR